MYELKTVLPTFHIKLPTCMYPIKVSPKRIKKENAADVSARTTCNVLQDFERQIKFVLKESSSDMAHLEARQAIVFKQLDELKKQLMNIRSQLNVCGKTASHVKQQTQQISKPIVIYEPLHDIVINAHPEYIPYGLLALKNVWKDIFNINVKVHSHSTISSLSKEALEFQENIMKNTSGIKSPNINIMLIWKNTEHTEMISSPTMYVPIYGEVNILRYLARVGPSEFRYEDTPLCNDADAILDICYQLLRCTTAKARQQLLRSLNTRLQKQTYFGGNNLSIADIGVCSSIRRMPSSTMKDLTENMNKWLTRVQKFTMI